MIYCLSLKAHPLGQASDSILIDDHHELALCMQTCIQHCLSNLFMEYSDKFPRPWEDIPNSGGKGSQAMDQQFG